MCVEQLRLGGKLEGKGDLKRSHVVCRYDSTARAPCPNENWLPVGVCDEQFTGSPLLVELKARSLASSREDENFLTALRHSATVKTGEFPPAALVELYHEPGAVAARLRRLHLIIVDLCHPRKTVTKIKKKFHRQITCVRDTGAVSITPIPLWDNEACVFGYSLDDSDKPVFLLWPERTESNGFWLLDVEIITFVRLPASRTLV